MTTERLLVIDDEPDFATFIRRVGNSLGHTVEVAAHASDFKENPDRWQCAFSYNAGGRAVWVYGDTVQWKPDAIATARSACRAKSPRCVSLGCFRRL